MKKTLKQYITGYNMPGYIVDILTMHYSSNFLNMTIIKEHGAYMFTYETDYFKKIEMKNLNPKDKYTLISTMIKINEENEEHLMFAENYLIEPELIYCLNNVTEKMHVRILFYPDFKRMEFHEKLLLFIDKIAETSSENTEEAFEDIKNAVNTMDIVSLLRYIDRLIKMEERIEKVS